MSPRDMVVRQVRSGIISGRSGPGTLYSAPSLADEIGISTTPVREALLELARSGLVVPMRNRSVRVVGTSLERLADLFAMRELLERFAIALPRADDKADRWRRGLAATGRVRVGYR